MEFSIVLIKVIISVEVLLIVLMLLIAFIAKARNDHLAKKMQKRKLALEKYLIFSVEQHQLPDLHYFHADEKEGEVLLLLIEELDETFKNNLHHLQWIACKNKITYEVLLPLARKLYKNKHWEYRLIAAKIFSIAIEEKDIPILHRLFFDSIPLVYEYSLIAASKYDYQVLTDAILTRIAKERKHAQMIIIGNLKNASPSFKKFIHERLTHETNPYIRATCFKILKEFPAEPSDFIYEKDLESSNIDNIIACIRYMVHCLKTHAIPLLIKLLHHSFFEVRAIAAKLLGHLKDPHLEDTIINALGNALHDTAWWVRVNAGEALKNQGEKGMELLRKQKTEIDKFAYETAQQILRDEENQWSI